MKKDSINKKQTHSLGFAIKRAVIILLAIPIILCLSIYGIYTSYRSTDISISQILPAMASISAKAASDELAIYSNVVEELARDEAIYNSEESKSKLTSLYAKKIESYNILDLYFVDKKGNCNTNGNNYFSTCLFQAALNGKTYVDVPHLDGTSKDLSICISTPVWENGVGGTKIIGVLVCVVPQSIINDVVTSISLSDNSKAVILNKDGNLVASENLQSVLNYENLYNTILKDSEKKENAIAIQDAMSGKSGVAQCKLDDEKGLFAFAPIPNREGWSLCISTPMKDFTTPVKHAILVFVGLGFVFLGYSVWGASYLSRSTVTPLGIFADSLSHIAKGDFTTPVPNLDPDLRIQDIINVHEYVRSVHDSNNVVIADIDFMLGQMAMGNFDIKSQISEKYIGDYSNILIAQNTIRDNLNKTLFEILMISQQVASGSKQVSAGSQALAQGATEQAASIEEIAATIEEMASQIKETAGYAKESNDVAENVGGMLEDGKAQMNELMNAMAEIQSKSSQI